MNYNITEIHKDILKFELECVFCRYFGEENLNYDNVVKSFNQLNEEQETEAWEKSLNQLKKIIGEDYNAWVNSQNF